MNEHQIGLLRGAALCRRFAGNLLHSELPNARETALECAVMIEEEAQLVPTLVENGVNACQEQTSIFFLPEIDYDSGLPRK